MQDLEFEWDDHKAQENLLRHGIDFRDALQVFFDPGLSKSRTIVRSTERTASV